MDIAVVNISKGPYELNKEVLNEIKAEKLSFNITPRLRYSTGSDYMGFQIDLTVMLEKTQVFKSGFLIGMAIVDWAKGLQEEPDLNSNRQKLNEICKTAWLVATGIVALQSADKNFNGIILPSINSEDMSKDVILIPSTASRP